MKAIEFKTKIEDQKILIPTNQEELKDGQEVKVIILIQEEGNDNSFQKLATAQFIEGYASEDSIYDSY